MTCPICGEATQKSYRPFCSRRCADRDLGRWMTGSYAIPASSEDEFEDFETEAADAPQRKH